MVFHLCLSNKYKYKEHENLGFAMTEDEYGNEVINCPEIEIVTIDELWSLLESCDSSLIIKKGTSGWEDDMPDDSPVIEIYNGWRE